MKASLKAKEIDIKSLMEIPVKIKDQPIDVRVK